jgi:quinol monooxygenase YgiN
MKYCLIILIAFSFCSGVFAQKKSMLIRISEIEIDSNYLEQYKAILKEEARASVELEKGVLSIFPMYQKESPTQVRILEIYATHEAYESHMKTPHFQKYKTTTLHMVKSLKLIDMEALDLKTMPQIFRKQKSGAKNKMIKN